MDLGRSRHVNSVFADRNEGDGARGALYTSGVPELKKALGASDDELLRLVKNIYGNATAPRGLWKDVGRTFTNLVVVASLGIAVFGSGHRRIQARGTKPTST